MPQRPKRPEPAAAGVSLRWLRDLLAARPLDEREDFLAAVLLNAGFDVDELTPPLQALMERFAIRADIEPGVPDRVRGQIEAYFASNPLPHDLVARFEGHLRAELLSQDPEALKVALAQLGRDTAVHALPEPPSEDRHPGGALGYFIARSRFDPR